MKYERFEQLPVWQASIELAANIYAFTTNLPFRGQYSLRDQLERATVSISNNIAEGFERGNNQELLAFLYIARGSSGEVRSMLCLLERLRAFKELGSEILALKSKAETISKQLGAWVRSVQNSGMKGERYVTDKIRKGMRQTSNEKNSLQDWTESVIAGLKSRGRSPHERPRDVESEILNFES